MPNNPFGRHTSDAAWARYIQKIVLDPAARVHEKRDKVRIVRKV